MRISPAQLLAALAALGAAAAAAAGGQSPAPLLQAPGRLRTDHAARPLGIQHQQPRLSWALLAEAPAATPRGLRQVAYQLVLSNGTHQLWDSGRVPSNRSAIHRCCSASGGPTPRAAVVFASDTVYSWRVRAWVPQDAPSIAAPGAPTPWSAAASFDTALFDASDWRGARWLGTGDSPMSADGRPPPPQASLFRVEFALPAAAVVRARVYVSGLGYYRMHLNGQRADGHELGALTVYERTLLYDAVDIGALLRPGAPNALAISLGRGWYSCSGCVALTRMGEACGRAGGATNATNPYPAAAACGQFQDWPLGPTGMMECGSPCPRSFLLRLVVTLADATVFELTSSPDGGWRRSDGPVVAESIYLGVVHDGRLEQPGWTLPGFVPKDPGRWTPATVPAVTPTGAPESLVAQSMPHIKKVRTISPSKISSVRPGVFIVDFGENMAGWTTITIGPNNRRGENITVVHAELLTASGRCWSCVAPMPMNITRVQDCPCRAPGEAILGYTQSPMVDVYVLKGDGEEEVFEPLGTYHGFRYAEVHGYPGVLSSDRIVAHTVHTGVQRAGAIMTSSALINQLQEACVRTILSNQMSMPTDCPHRERRGWGGDAQVSSDTAAWNFDMASYWVQYLGTIVDNQAKYAVPAGIGGISGVIPSYGYGGGGTIADPIWAAILPRLWHHCLQFYDDLATVGKFYVQIKAYIDFLLQGVDERGVLIIPGSSLGDWVAPINVSGTAIPSGTPPIPGHHSLLLSTAVLLENLQLFIDGAAALGKAADAAKYSARRVELLAQFRTMHFNATGKGVFEDMCGNYTELEPNPIR